MRLRFATIPIQDAQGPAAELNRVRAPHGPHSLGSQLGQDGARSAWVVCAAHVDGAR